MRAGYTDLFHLDGGVAAWAAAGLVLFSGVNVPSKAFGEFVEHASATPSIEASELDRLIRAGTDMVVLDSRPFDEYQRVSIPTAVNVPGAELVLRIRDIAPSPETLVVVNCAGRTRSIIGAQSLINAGVPNKVVALRNGTMGWSLAGLACESGKTRRAGAASRDAVAWAKTAADRVAQRFGIERIDRATLERWQAERDERTLYLFDVRDPPEYEAGHVAGALSAPGGQLVQATDQYVGTLGARIVLVDDAEVRAVMTASWLRQMGWQDVFVLVEAGTETGRPAPTILGDAPPPELRIDCAGLAGLAARNDATVVDLSLSRDYRKAHIPGAWFAIRSRLAQALAKIPLRGTLVLTSEDGVLAGLAAPEAACARRSSRPLPRRRKCGVAGGRTCAHGRGRPDGGRCARPLAQALRAAERYDQGDERVSLVGGRPARAHRARRLDRFHAISSSIENLAEIALRDLNVIVVLQIEPKLCRCAERLGEPKRSIGGNAGLFAGDPLDPCARQAAGLGKSARRHFQRNQELLPQNLTGMHGLELLGHCRVLF